MDKRTQLVCFDLDGVIFKDVNFWMELHKVFGTLAEGKRLTEQYLISDYGKLVEEVVGRLWKGKDAAPYNELVNSLEYIDGVDEVVGYCKHKGYTTAIVSASSIDCCRRAARDLGIDYIFGNELVIKDGKVSGEFHWPIGAGGETKAQIVRDLANEVGIKLENVVYIGDGEADIAAFGIVGKSIAFNPVSETVADAAELVVNENNLSSVIRYF